MHFKVKDFPVLTWYIGFSFSCFWFHNKLNVFSQWPACRQASLAPGSIFILPVIHANRHHQPLWLQNLYRICCSVLMLPLTFPSFSHIRNKNGKSALVGPIRKGHKFIYVVIHTSVNRFQTVCLSSVMYKSVTLLTAWNSFLYPDRFEFIFFHSWHFGISASHDLKASATDVCRRLVPAGTLFFFSPFLFTLVECIILPLCERLKNPSSEIFFFFFFLHSGLDKPIDS